MICSSCVSAVDAGTPVLGEVAHKEKGCLGCDCQHRTESVLRVDSEVGQTLKPTDC